MTLIELEQQALRLTLADRLRLIQTLVQSLGTLLPPSPTPPAEPVTVASAIASFRQTLATEGLCIEADEIWGDVRDRTPAPDLPQW